MRLRVALALPLVPLALAACGAHHDAPAADPLDNPTASPMRATYDGYTVVWLKGSPYEMGLQHAKLLHDELAEGVTEIRTDPLLAMMAALARTQGLIDLAKSNSYPDFIEECQGMVDGAADVGWTMEDCLVLNFGDALTEFLGATLAAGNGEAQPGCTQIVTSGPATRDGHLYHARIMDWSEIDYIVEHPTIFVRQPDGGVPHLVIGFPGNISPYQGMNAAGLTVGTNQIHSTQVVSAAQAGDRRSSVQLAGEVLSHARSLDEARAMVMQTPHLTHLTMVVSDANAGAGEVYEITPTTVGVRPTADGFVYATNHFVSDATKGMDIQPPATHSTLRWERLGQLVPPAAPATKYGAFDLASLVGVLRDRVNAETGAVSDASYFDDGQTLATDGALYEAVFDPSRLQVWVAAGGIPVPTQRFVGFSLARLLGQGAAPPTPATIE